MNPDYSIFNELTAEDVIFFMTAYSNPNWISENKEKTKLLNYTKTVELIDHLKIKCPKFIFMSSVEVFDGIKGNYLESIPRPLNYYGMLKRDVEIYLQKNYPNYCIVRTGWNVGLNKKSRCVIQLTYETLMKPNAKMAVDNFFSLAFVEDTAEGLSRLIENNEIKKIHICSNEVLCRKDLADKIINYSSNGSYMKYSECVFDEIPYK